MMCSVLEQSAILNRNLSHKIQNTQHQTFINDYVDTVHDTWSKIMQIRFHEYYNTNDN